MLAMVGDLLGVRKSMAGRRDPPRKDLEALPAPAAAPAAVLVPICVAAAATCAAARRRSITPPCAHTAQVMKMNEAQTGLILCAHATKDEVKAVAKWRV
mmetsp:Transcript_129383/g.235149  ORF Transcript_129383/g.235149 Transcript_129383/m.235149 type:complete len:99 (-) Transcript_129383:9-305(-)